MEYGVVSLVTLSRLRNYTRTGSASAARRVADVNKDREQQ